MHQRVDHAATRQHPRFPLRMPVLCESPAIPGYRALGLTWNVSRGGLLLEVPQPLSPGTPADLLLLTWSQNARAEAAAVWAAESPPSRMGLRFTKLTGTDRVAWERLLAFQAGPTPRTSIRIPIALEVTCRIPPGTWLPGQAENLSDGGLLLVLPRVIAGRTRVTVRVPPLLAFPSVEAEMDVVWTRSAPRGHGVLHGLRFCWDDISKELFLIGVLLRQFVDSDATTPGRKGEGAHPVV
ncbi:MAG: PilZ domain-containing protein [Candidatus Methylomirabilales bacterium]